MRRLTARLRTPQGVALLLALAGVIGGASVYNAGRAVRRSDLAAFGAWERDVGSAIDRAIATHAGLAAIGDRVRAGSTGRAVERQLTATRASLERARREILGVPIPRILHKTAAAYLEGIARSLEGVSALQDVVNGATGAARAERIAAYERASALADTRFADARTFHDTLRTRLRLRE